jgi:hypothetical protein
VPSLLSGVAGPDPSAASVPSSASVVVSTQA